MILYVHKHPEDPSGVADCMEVQEGQTPPRAPWEPMSIDAFEKWAEPYRAIVQASKAEALAEEQAITKDEVPQRLDEVQTQVDQIVALIQEFRALINPTP